MNEPKATPIFEFIWYLNLFVCVRVRISLVQYKFSKKVKPTPKKVKAKKVKANSLTQNAAAART